jgi:hypothetical protein
MTTVYSPPVSTYTALATATLSGSSSSVTFSSIPSTDLNGNTIRDLIVIFNGSGARYLAVQINGDTGSNYNTISLYGTGTNNGTSGVLANFGYIFASWSAATTSGIRSGSIQFVDAKANDKHKSLLIRHNDTGASGSVELNAARWANSNPITSIKVYSDSGTILGSDTTISLYAVVA